MGLAFTLAAALVLAMVFVPFLLKKGKYGRLFADAHFLEIARALPALRAAALDRIADDEPPKPPDDPRVLLTSADLIVVYTVSADDGQFVHHWSVGLRGQPTAVAVGESFALFLAQLLGVPLGDVLVHRQPSTVHHVTVLATREAHEAMASRALGEPTGEELARWREERATHRKEMGALGSTPLPP